MNENEEDEKKAEPKVSHLGRKLRYLKFSKVKYKDEDPLPEVITKNEYLPSENCFASEKLQNLIEKWKFNIHKNHKNTTIFFHF